MSRVLRCLIGGGVGIALLWALSLSVRLTWGAPAPLTPPQVGQVAPGETALPTLPPPAMTVGAPATPAPRSTLLPYPSPQPSTSPTLALPITATPSAAYPYPSPTLPPPANDECAMAAEIPASGPWPYLAQENTRAAGPAAEAAVCGDFITSHSVWFRWTAPADGQFDMATCGSDYDTVLTVWEGECGALAAPLVCDDDSCGYQSQARLAARVGVTYLVRVAAYDISRGGQLALSASFHAGATDTPTLPPPPTATGTPGPYPYPGPTHRLPSPTATATPGPYPYPGPTLTATPASPTPTLVAPTATTPACAYPGPYPTPGYPGPYPVPCATAAVVPTATATATASGTIPPTKTATATSTPTLKATDTPTLTPTVTPTVTLTPTPSYTPTITPTSTPVPILCDPINPNNVCGGVVVARVYIDYGCDKYFNLGTDWPLAEAEVVVRLSNGALIQGRTRADGTVALAGVHILKGATATVSLGELPPPTWLVAQGGSLEACSSSPTTRTLSTSDFRGAGLAMLDFRFTIHP